MEGINRIYIIFFYNQHSKYCGILRDTIGLFESVTSFGQQIYRRITEIWGNVDETMSDFIVSIVPADVLAPLGCSIHTAGDDKEFVVDMTRSG